MRAVLCTCTSLLQDLVSKNEALRRQLHELDVHTEQQLRKKDAAAQAEEERRSQLYQKAMDEAKQRIAEHVVGFHTTISQHVVKQHASDCNQQCPTVKRLCPRVQHALSVK